MKPTPLSSTHSWISGCVLSWTMSQHWVSYDTTRDSFSWYRQFHGHQERYVSLHTSPYHDYDYFAAMPLTDQDLGKKIRLTPNPITADGCCCWFSLLTALAAMNIREDLYHKSRSPSTAAPTRHAPVQALPCRKCKGKHTDWIFFRD